MIEMRKLPVKYILKVENLIADQYWYRQIFVIQYLLLENQFQFHVSATLAGTWIGGGVCVYHSASGHFAQIPNFGFKMLITLKL